MSAPIESNGVESHREQHPVVAGWLKQPRDHWLLQLLDAPRDPEGTGTTVADKVLQPLEKMAAAVAEADPRGLARFVSSRFRDADPANMWSARLELVCAAKLASADIPFAFGATGEPDLTWYPGTVAQGWLEIHRGGFSGFDDVRQDLEKELANLDAHIEVRLGAWPLKLEGGNRNGLLSRVELAAQSAKTGSEVRVDLPELGPGASGVVRNGPRSMSPARVSVAHAGFQPSERYLTSLAAALARKVNIDKAGQSRRGSWDPRTVLLIDISTAHLMRLLSTTELTEWLDGTPIEWDGLPFAGVAVCFTDLHSTEATGLCRYRDGLPEAERMLLDSALSAMGLPSSG